MAIRGSGVTSLTPVLQSHGQTGIITPSKKRHLFPRTPLRGEQSLEVPVLSLAAAEDALHEMESGSVLAFISSEPCPSRGGGPMNGSRSCRHQLFISWKYRRSQIHFDYYWVHLKNFCRDRHRPVFHTEQRHFEVISELFLTFVPMLRDWLSAIVKAANFIDQPVESVDLWQLLRVRHHLVLTQSTNVSASVVLCKLDPETRKIVSKAVIFDFKARRIRDDGGASLRSFLDVFQQFLGLHPGHGHALMPSPREEDEEEPRTAISLLQGLEAETDNARKLQRLLHIQAMVRKEIAIGAASGSNPGAVVRRLGAAPESGGGPPKLQYFELMTTLLLPMLIHSAPPIGGVVAAPRAATPALATAVGSGADGGTTGGAVHAGEVDWPFSNIQVIISDILADLCELHTEVVGAHVWRMCKGYLEDPANWLVCLGALELLMLMSQKLVEWLILHTDVVTRLFSTLLEAQQYLMSQREAAIAAAGGHRVSQPLHSKYQWPPRVPANTSGNSGGGDTSAGLARHPTPSRGVGDWCSTAASSGAAASQTSMTTGHAAMFDQPPQVPALLRWEQAAAAASNERSQPTYSSSVLRWEASAADRRKAAGGPGLLPPPLPQAPDHKGNEDIQETIATPQPTSCVSGSPRGSMNIRTTALAVTERGRGSPMGTARRAPSFDNFDGPQASSRRFEGETSRARSGSRSNRLPSHERAELQQSEGVRSSEVVHLGGSDTRSSRPLKVPPLNLNLASRLPVAGSTGAGAQSPADKTPAKCSMTRSSRRDRIKELSRHGSISASSDFGRQGGPSIGAAGSTNNSASPQSLLQTLHHTVSAPLLGMTGMKLFGGCTLAPTTATPVSAQGASAPKAFGEPASGEQKQAMQQAEEMAKALGEAALLADLSSILKYRQEQQVQDAVKNELGRPSGIDGSSLYSPGKPGSGTATPRAAAATPPTTASASTPITPLLGASHATSGVGGKERIPSSPASATPQAGTASRGGACGSGGTPIPALPSPSPRGDRRMQRLVALRRVRLYAGLVLGRLSSCAPWASKLIGPHVPVSKLFEMFQASCTRTGGCSFCLDDDWGTAEDPLSCSSVPRSSGNGNSAGGHAVSVPLSAVDANGHHKLFMQKVSPVMLQRMSWLTDQLRKSNGGARRCACGANQIPRGGSSTSSNGEDFCGCVDDVLASCIWRLLAAHAQHVEELHLRRALPVQTPAEAAGSAGVGVAVLIPGTTAAGATVRDADAAAASSGWDCLPNAWHVREGLDHFLVRLSRALVQALLQLKSAHGATTAGPEAVASLQHRIAFLVRIVSNYVRRCGGRAMPLQTFEVLKPAFMILKQHLCICTDASSPAFLQPATVRLWVAYLHFVGVMIRACVRSGGLHCPSFAEALVVHFLDFVPPPASGSLLSSNVGTGSLSLPPASSSARQAPNFEKEGSAHADRSTTPMRAPHLANSSSADPKRVAKSQSLRVIHGPGHSGSAGSAATAGGGDRGGGPPPRLPLGAFSGTSTPGTAAQAFRSKSPTRVGAGQQGHASASSNVQNGGPSRVCVLLPRVLSRVFEDVGLEDGADIGSATRSVSSMSSSTRPRPGVPNSDETAESLCCRVLYFVEALLQVGRSIGVADHAPRPRNAAIAPPQAPTSGRPAEDGAHADQSAGGGHWPGHLVDELHRSGIIGNHDELRIKARIGMECLMQSLLEWMQFLLLPPKGLLCRLASRQPLVGGPLVVRLVLCERALFQALAITDAPYILDAHASEYYVRRHFLNFVRLYNSRSADAASDKQLVQLCSLHLETLLGLARLQPLNDLPRHAFHRLSVLDFLAGEVDLEHETTQMRDRFLRAARQTIRRQSGSSAGSCTSSPSVAPPSMQVGRVSSVATLASVSTAPTFPLSNTPPIDAASSQRDTAIPSVAPTLAPTSLQGAPKRAVPKLQFRGIRPSLQGCSGLGAPPPEEPGIGDADGVAQTQVPSTQVPHAMSVESNQLQSIPANSVDDDDDDSSEAEDEHADAEAPTRRPAVVPRLAMPGKTASVGVESAHVCTTKPTITAQTSLQRVPSSSNLFRPTIQHPPDSVDHGAKNATPLSSSDESTPRRIENPPCSVSRVVPSIQAVSVPHFKPLPHPVVPSGRPVPKLAFFGLRPSLQGTSGLGAPPPEEDTRIGGDIPTSHAGHMPQQHLLAPQPHYLSQPSCAPDNPGAMHPLSPPPPSQDSDSSSPAEEQKQTETVPDSSSSDEESPDVRREPVVLKEGVPDSSNQGPLTLSLCPAAKSTAAPTWQQVVGDIDIADSGSSGSGDSSSPDTRHHNRIQWHGGFDAKEGEPEPWAPEAPCVRPPSSGFAGLELPPGPQLDSIGGQPRSSSSGLPGAIVPERPSESVPTSTFKPVAPVAVVNMGQRKPIAAVGVPQLTTAAAGRSPVPKLAFRGLRPSMQGCSGLGAPPPEEPGIDVNTAYGGDPPLQQMHTPISTALPPTVLPPASLPPGSLQTPTGPPYGPLETSHAIEWGTPTPTGSGNFSPMAGSSASQPCGDSNSNADLHVGRLIKENIFYFKGRERRRIYDDHHLHALMITLILALLVTPKKGLLDSRYCEQYPMQNRKRNIPFLLSLHLNHSANAAMLSWLSQQVDGISQIGGFRLLKLLCQTAMHRWMYSGASRLGGGQFGTVYSCTVQLGETRSVAVKQIQKQNNIEDRCVFFDVFSEMACLDVIRFEKHVCQLFDYGVDETCYWIVMKSYPTTVKKWRESLEGTMSENLASLLAVYKQVLQAVHTLHWHGVVHYDLKCDNIMIDFDRGEHMPRINLVESLEHPVTDARPGEIAPAREDRQEPSRLTDVIPCVALVDFGESMMFANAEDVDTRNRGTELIKCPEMLEIENFGRKDGIYFDRRKRVGTNEAADIWSLGCLLFELLTSQFLFEHDDVASFFTRVTGKMFGIDSDVVSLANCQLLENNTPMLELIRFMLVRDPAKRPSIGQLLPKFDASSEEALKVARAQLGGGSQRNLSESVTMCRQSSGKVTPDSPRSVTRSVGGSSGGGPRSHGGGVGSKPDRPLVCMSAAGDGESYFTRVLQDLSVVEIGEEDLDMTGAIGNPRCAGGVEEVISKGFNGGGCRLQGTLGSRLSRTAWTHVVDFRIPGAAQLPIDATHVLKLPWSSTARDADDLLEFLPMVFDFLRHAAVHRGVVLFVDGHASVSAQDRPSDSGITDPETAINGDLVGIQSARRRRISESGNELVGGASGSGRGGLAMASVLAVVSEAYHLAAYAALSFMSSQLLVAAIRPDAVIAVASWQESKRRTAWQRCDGRTRVACLCGACSWHVPDSWLHAATENTKFARENVRLASELDPCQPLVSHSTPESCANSHQGGREPWLGPSHFITSCSCSSTSGPNHTQSCPCPRGFCESYMRWLQARFGLKLTEVTWLWLPEGCAPADYADSLDAGNLTRGLAACAEPVGEAAAARSPVPSQRSSEGSSLVPPLAQRYRCRWCKVLTHVEIPKTTSCTGMSTVTAESGLRATATAQTDAQPHRAAIVLSYELLRAESLIAWQDACGATTLGSESVGGQRPPTRLHSTGLDEVVFPRAQSAFVNYIRRFSSHKAEVARRGS